MRTKLRASAMVLLAVVLLMGVMPSSALGAVTMTWERNWGSQGTLPTLADGEFYYPKDVATDKWGNVYVAGGESGDHRVQMFSPTGTFISYVGTTGAESTLLDSPRAVTTDRWGNIYVSEQGNGARISVFFPELYSGVSARTIDGTGDSAIDDPRNLAAGLDGYLYVSADGYTIQQWTTGGTFVHDWTAAGAITEGVGVAQEGDIYTTTDITSGITNSVVKYNPWGGATWTHGVEPGRCRASSTGRMTWGSIRSRTCTLLRHKVHAARCSSRTARISPPSARRERVTASSTIPTASASGWTAPSTWPSTSTTVSPSGT